MPRAPSFAGRLVRPAFPIRLNDVGRPHTRARPPVRRAPRPAADDARGAAAGKGTVAMQIVIGLLIGLVLGGGGAFAYFQLSARNTLTRAREEAEQLKANALAEAQNKAKEIELSAKQDRLKERESFERENQAALRKLEDHELRLTKREDILDKKLDTLGVKEKNLDDLERRLNAQHKSVQQKDEQLTKALAEQRERLLQLAGMSAEQAREALLTASSRSAARTPAR
jgi:ribonuclease Y